MAAVAFGIFLTTVGNIYRFVESHRTDYLEQLQMAELAQSEIERIKIMANENLNNIPSQWEETLVYPNEEQAQQQYNVKYTTTPFLEGKMLKLSLGNAPDQHVYAAWLPPRKTIQMYEEQAVVYNPENWSTYIPGEEDEPDMGGWDIVPGEQPGDPPYLIANKSGNMDPIYSLLRSYNPEFEYKVDIKVADLGNGVCESGLIVLDDTNNTTYKFYFQGTNNNVNLKVDYPGGTFNLINNMLIYENITYYFKVNFNTGSPGTIMLNFGHYDLEGSPQGALNNHLDTVSNFSISSHNYYLGLYNKTAQTSFHYNLPTLSGGAH